MKLKVAATAAALAAIGTGAHAQTSVAVYGIIDAGVMSQSHTSVTPTPANPNGTGPHVLSFVDAQILPSIYGFRGSEDLGGGLKAGFELEGGFNAGDGAHNSPGVYQTQIFGRVAKVTLGGDWGTFGAGMQFDPAIVASIGTEPRELADSFSQLENWILATVGNGGATGALTGGIFDQNALTYTYAGHGLLVGLEYGFGGIAGSTTANSTESVGLAYHIKCEEEKAGGSGASTGWCDSSGFAFSAGYSEAKNANPTIGGKSSVIYNVGGAYELGPVAARAQYGDYKSGYANGSTANDNVKSWGVGVDFKLIPANVINLAYYQSKDTGAGPEAATALLNAAPGTTKEIALLDKYALSRRTSVYAQVVDVKTPVNAGLGAAIGGVYVASGLTAPGGVSTTFVGIGMQHVF